MYNHISVVGWLSDNINTGATSTGSGYVKFSVGSKKNYPKKENGQDVLDANGRKIYESSFFNVTIWGKNAEYVAGLNLAKGDLVAVYGFMDLKYYNDNAGVRKLSADLNADKVCLLKKKFQQEGGFQQQPQGGFQQQPQGGFQQQPQGGFQQQPQQNQPPVQHPPQQPANFSSPQQQPAAFSGNQQSPIQNQPPVQPGASYGFGAPAGGQQVFNQPTNF